MDTPIVISALPLYVWTVSTTLQCGFPSPADDHTEQRLDLSNLLVQQPDATFFMRVRGTSMRDAGIDDGDLVVIDRSVNAKHGQIVVAVVDGEFTIKRLHMKRNVIRLEAANPTFPSILLKDGQELTIWGVVTWTLKKHSHGA